MTYDLVINQVRTLPEPLLVQVSAFIDTLKNTASTTLKKNQLSDKRAFFSLAGKIQLDSQEVERGRVEGLI